MHSNPFIHDTELIASARLKSLKGDNRQSFSLDGRKASIIGVFEAVVKHIRKKNFSWKILEKHLVLKRIYGNQRH